MSAVFLDRTSDLRQAASIHTVKDVLQRLAHDFLLFHAQKNALNVFSLILELSIVSVLKSFESLFECVDLLFHIGHFWLLFHGRNHFSLIRHRD